MNKVKKFINSPQRNIWLDYEDKKVFIRKSQRLNKSNEVLKCFDIANITVDNPGSGVFTNWLAELVKLLEKHPEFDAIYVESVLNPEFAEYFRKRAWQETTWYNSESVNFLYDLK